MILTMVFATASAEQPAAEKYRQIFKSGEFYVEYEVANLGWVNIRIGANAANYKGDTPKTFKKNSAYIIIGEKDGKRAKGIFGKGTVYGFMESMASSVPNNKTVPDVLYTDGKYYRISTSEKVEWKPFVGKKQKNSVKAIMLPENKLNSELLDKAEKWDRIRVDLALPDELSIFCWNEPYRNIDSHTEMPQFTGSGKQTVNKKEYDCDEYVLCRNVNGSEAKEVYRTLYENGEIVYAQKYVIRNNTPSLEGFIKVRKIDSSAPSGMFLLPVGTKIYAADEGQMYDLTEQGLVLEEVGKR